MAEPLDHFRAKIRKNHQEACFSTNSQITPQGFHQVKEVTSKSTSLGADPRSLEAQIPSSLGPGHGALAVFHTLHDRVTTPPQSVVHK